MHLLVCAATAQEIAPLEEFLKQHPEGNHRIDLLITGVGSVAATYHLTRALADSRPDYVLQGGIAGSFDAGTPPGKAVFIFEEILGDCGAEEKDGWMDLFDLALVKDEFPFTEKRLTNPYCSEWEKYGLPFVRSVSVSEISTSPERINQLIQKYRPVVESMEGAAFHYVCLREHIPFMQLRVVSNHVGERNKLSWKLEEAVEQLNTELKKIIISLP